MKQYCRYCVNMCCADANYCDVKNRTYSDSYIKSVNKCKSFEFNPIDALAENESGYKPRKNKNIGQMSLFEEETKC